MNHKRNFYIILCFILLTLLTQIGGIVLLICIPFFNLINKKINNRWVKKGIKWVLFVLLYANFTFLIVPPLAQKLGRVPMPYGKDNTVLKPHNFITVIANRHYVTPSLRQITEGVAAKIAEKNRDTIAMRYLDCCFPFWDAFPLFPHLSHDDGRKIDLAFYYTQSFDNQPISDSPSWLGYGVSEEPKAGEENQPEYCREKGEWQYSFMQRYIIPQFRKADFKFDMTKNMEMVRYFTQDNRVRMLLIEPHLKTRLGFQKSNKVRLPPCHAVRHDDHIHVVVD